MTTQVADLVRKIYHQQLESARPKRKSLEYIWTLLGVILLVFFIGGALLSYNGFVNYSTDVLEDGAQIAKEITRRKNLIPNLLAAVKNYASYEKSVFLQTTEGRKAFAKINRLSESLNNSKETGFNGALTKLLAIAEQYPILKADTVFTNLINNLSDCEDRIAAKREKYNHDVNVFNTYRARFPAIIYALLFGYKPYGFYEEAGRVLPVIDEFENRVRTEQ